MSPFALLVFGLYCAVETMGKISLFEICCILKIIFEQWLVLREGYEASVSA